MVSQFLRIFDTEELSTLSSITAWAFTLILRNAMASPRTREHPHKSLALAVKDRCCRRLRFRCRLQRGRRIIEVFFPLSTPPYDLFAVPTFASHPHPAEPVAGRKL